MLCSAYPGCALNKDCFCTTDEHCAKGMSCVPSVAHPEFTVCKPDWRKFDKEVQAIKSGGPLGMLGYWERYKRTGSVFSSTPYAAQFAIVGDDA